MIPEAEKERRQKIAAQKREKAKADRRRNEEIKMLEWEEEMLPRRVVSLDERWRALGLEPPDRNRAREAMEEEAAIREEDAKWAGIFAAKNFAFTVHVGARESQK